jgi:tRNA(Ile)-lysidine synthase
MLKMIRQIKDTNAKFKLIDKGDRLLIALSGGPDSVTLLHTLAFLADEYQLTLAAVHINHQLRHDADYDQRFCRELCRAHNIKCHSVKADIAKLAKKRKIGIEQAAREYRYDYFRSICDKYGYAKVVTGHTADDSSETFLFNLIRGANLSGLGGIPPKRDNIIRPLIEIPKAEILGFLNENGLSYHLDSSNLNIEYSRNLIRNNVIPTLRKLNPQASAHIARSALELRYLAAFFENEIAKAYETCLVKQACGQINLDLAKLPVYYKSLDSWIVLRAYSEIANELRHPGSKQIEKVLRLSRSGSIAFLGEGVIVCYYNGRLIFSRPSEAVKRIKLKINDLNKLGKSGLVIDVREVEEFDRQRIFANADESVAFLDNAKVGDLSVRSLKPGDKFKPLGMIGVKKLADYLNEKGVPQINKKAVPIVVSGKDILWVAGYGIADKYKVTAYTKVALKLELTGSRD